jgi:predicted lactoylglutathione lyase
LAQGKSELWEVKIVKLFNNVQIKVNDLNNSRNFYDAVMKILGYQVVLDEENVVIGYGTDVHDMFEIRQSDANAPLSRHVHIAFNASSKKIVDDFYDIALKNGASCNGKPGFRPEYEDGYYAAFVIDPDGHNIEAVFSKK